eukprot:3102324-Pyramimonas_sp.AAC.1
MKIAITARRHIPKPFFPSLVQSYRPTVAHVTASAATAPSAAASAMAGPPPVRHGGAALVGQPHPEPHLPPGAHRRLLRPQRRPQEDPR